MLHDSSRMYTLVTDLRSLEQAAIEMGCLYVYQIIDLFVAVYTIEYSLCTYIKMKFSFYYFNNIHAIVNLFWNNI